MMMGGFGVFALLFMFVGMLFCVALIVGIVWLVTRWANNQKNASTMPYTPPGQNASRIYEQGYQSPESAPEAYQEGREQYYSPRSQYEQPQAQYPQEQELPPQH